LTANITALSSPSTPRNTEAGGGGGGGSGGDEEEG